MSDNIIYFEVNNWFAGRDYPDCEPFTSWLGDIGSVFNNDEWFKQQKICVVHELIDMSDNYKITATQGWVEKNCPSLFNDENKKFICNIDLDDYDEEDDEYYEQCRYGNGPFLKYSESNFGVHEYDYYSDCWYSEKYVETEEDVETDEDEI